MTTSTTRNRRPSVADLQHEVTALRRELAEARDQQTATAQVLEAISRSPADLQRVLDTICESAGRLCGGWRVVVSRVEGASIRFEASWISPERAAQAPAPPRLGSTTPLDAAGPRGLAVRERRTQYVPDLQALPADDPRLGSGGALRAGVRTNAAVPLLRGEEAVGVLSVTAPEPDALTAQHLTLLETFADQAVIAIENARLFHELQERQLELEERNAALAEALEQQTATANVLRVIAGSPTNTDRVLDEIAESAVQLCRAANVTIRLVDGEHLRVAANAGDGPPLGLLQPLAGAQGTHVRALLQRRTIHIADVAAAADEDRHVPPGVRAYVAVPLVRDGAAVGVLNVRRTEPRPFTEAEQRLLESFADQAVIAIENARLFQELQDRNRTLQEALEQQTATAEVLAAISRAPTDLQQVLDTIAESAARLCGTDRALIFRVEGDTYRGVAGLHLDDRRPTLLESELVFPLAQAREGIAGRAIADGAVVHIADLAAVPKAELPARRPRAAGVRTVLAVPLFRQGVGIGAITLNRQEVLPFTDQQIKLLETFADQAVIAIENTRLFQELEDRNRELTEALEQQTATAQVLEVISRAPTDLQQVLDTIIENAARLCNVEDAQLQILHDDGLRVAASFGPLPARSITGDSHAPVHEWAVGRSVLNRQTIHIPDITAPEADEFSLSRLAADLHGWRSTLVAPLMREDAAIGTIAVYGRDASTFPDRQIRLLETFAAQAVIAIENARLFSELQQRLEEQTVTGEVLKVISGSPTDLQKVLDTITEVATRLCGSDGAQVFRIESDGYRAVAGRRADGSRPTLSDPGPEVPLTRGHPVGRAMLDREVGHIHDLHAVPVEEMPATNPRRLGLRTMLSVPLLRQGTSVGAIGALSLARQDVRPFTERQIALVQTFADQAVIAIENARLFTALQERTRDLGRSVDELTALAEVTQAVSSTLDVGTVLARIVDHARRLSGSDGGAVFEYDEAADAFELRAAHGLDEALVAVLRERRLRLGEGVTGRAAAARAPEQVPDVLEEGAYGGWLRESVVQAGYRSLLAVPLLREDRVLGGLVVNRRTAGTFAPEVVALLQTFANQSALAIQNARLFSEIEDKSRQLEEASRHKSQFLANMSHELRTPLNAILGYTELIVDGIYGAVPAKLLEVLDRVQQSGQHLLGLINAVLDLSKIEAGQLVLSLQEYSVKEVVYAVCTQAESLAAEKGLRLQVAVAPDLPTGRGDERRLTQVLLNLVGNAIKFTDAGTVAVKAALEPGPTSQDDGPGGGGDGHPSAALRPPSAHFVVSVTDTGPGVAEAERERIFEEFQQADGTATRQKGGTGLGLAIARRIVELHGGRIWVESTPGQGATFAFAVPVRVEQQAQPGVVA